MIDNQLGRRNLTERQMSYLRGERYKLETQKIGGNQYARKTDPQFEDPSHRISERLATQYTVSRGTIERDAAYASDINAIAAVADSQGARIVMETEGKLGRKEVKARAERSQSNPEATKCQ